MIDVDLGQPMTTTLAEARRLKKVYRVVLQNDPCAFCGHRPGDGEDRRKRNEGTIDHIVPKSKAKKHRNRSPKQHEERGWENWTGCCFSCNAAKRDLDLLTFLLKPNRPKGKKWPTKRS